MGIQTFLDINLLRSDPIYWNFLTYYHGFIRSLGFLDKTTVECSPLRFVYLALCVLAPCTPGRLRPFGQNSKNKEKERSHDTAWAGANSGTALFNVQSAWYTLGFSGLQMRQT